MARRPSRSLAPPDQSTAYRGYYVKDLGMHGFSIQADGAHIGYAKSVEEAKRIIDEILGPRSNPRSRILADLRRRLEPQRAIRRNPSYSRTVEAAAQLHRDFSGHEPEAIEYVPDPDRPGARVAALAVGELLGVIYRTRRDGKVEEYLHEFRQSSRPLLAARHDGRHLYIVGGRYRFTDRGIVDE